MQIGVEERGFRLRRAGALPLHPTRGGVAPSGLPPFRLRRPGALPLDPAKGVFDPSGLPFRWWHSWAERRVTDAPHDLAWVGAYGRRLAWARYIVGRGGKLEARPVYKERPRRFPKGDRKALWSPPQRRNSCNNTNQLHPKEAAKESKGRPQSPLVASAEAKPLQAKEL